MNDQAPCALKIALSDLQGKYSLLKILVSQRVKKLTEEIDTKLGGIIERCKKGSVE